MSQQLIIIPAGSSSNTIDLSLIQGSAATSPGAPATGFTAGTLTAYSVTGAAAPAAVSLASLASNTAAYSSGGIYERDSTHMPGQYRFDLPNALIASPGEVNLCFTGTNLDPHHVKILATQVNLYSVASLFQTQMGAPSVPAVGTQYTPEQALSLLTQLIMNFNYNGTTLTIYGLNGSTPLATVTLNSATNPTAGARAT